MPRNQRSFGAVNTLIKFSLRENLQGSQMMLILYIKLKREPVFHVKHGFAVRSNL